MKIIVLLFSVLFLYGCDDSSRSRADFINLDKENNPYLGRFKQYGTGTDVDVVVDTKTGCEYLTGSHNGIQPINTCGEKQ